MVGGGGEDYEVIHSSDHAVGVATWQPLGAQKTASPALRRSIRMKIWRIFRSPRGPPGQLLPRPTGSMNINPAFVGSLLATGGSSALYPHGPTSANQNPGDPVTTSTRSKSRGAPDNAVVQAIREKVNELLDEAHNTRAEALRLMEDGPPSSPSATETSRRKPISAYSRPMKWPRATPRPRLASLIESSQGDRSTRLPPGGPKC